MKILNFWLFLVIGFNRVGFKTFFLCLMACSLAMRKSTGLAGRSFTTFESKSCRIGKNAKAG